MLPPLALRLLTLSGLPVSCDLISCLPSFLAFFSCLIVCLPACLPLPASLRMSARRRFASRTILRCFAFSAQSAIWRFFAVACPSSRDRCSIWTAGALGISPGALVAGKLSRSGSRSRAEAFPSSLPAPSLPTLNAKCAHIHRFVTGAGTTCACPGCRRLLSSRPGARARRKGRQAWQTVPMVRPSSA